MKRIIFLVFFFLFTCTFVFAADQRCSNAQGTMSRDLPGGYVAQVAPATDDAHSGQCRAAIVSSDHKLVAAGYGAEAELNNISGADVNGDGKPDAVLETHPAPGQCCFNYYVVSLGEPAGLIRQITTSVPLTFEDKLGDGKVEIWGRDYAFDGIDNFAHSDSPFPLVFFRMKGANIYNVSTLFWSEYEREITQTRALISRNDLDDLLKIESDDKKPEEHSPKDEVKQRTRALVLQIALDYLYGGKGQEAWKTISDMWTPLDRSRIRQEILLTRTRGILGEINRPPKPATQTPVANNSSR